MCNVNAKEVEQLQLERVMMKPEARSDVSGYVVQI
jgi:hypothetical protein